MAIEKSISESGIDLLELLIRVDNDCELLREVFVLFEGEFPRIFQALTSATTRGDMKETHHLAHTLKGMLAGLSFTDATSSAARIEQMAAQSNAEQISQEPFRLQQQVAEGRSFLERTCSEVAA